MREKEREGSTKGKRGLFKKLQIPTPPPKHPRSGVTFHYVAVFVEKYFLTQKEKELWMLLTNIDTYKMIPATKCIVIFSFCIVTFSYFLFLHCNLNFHVNCSSNQQWVHCQKLAPNLIQFLGWGQIWVGVV